MLVPINFNSQVVFSLSFMSATILRHLRICWYVNNEVHLALQQLSCWTGVNKLEVFFRSENIPFVIDCSLTSLSFFACWAFWEGTFTAVSSLKNEREMSGSSSAFDIMDWNNAIPLTSFLVARSYLDCQYWNTDKCQQTCCLMYTKWSMYCLFLLTLISSFTR